MVSQLVAAIREAAIQLEHDGRSGLARDLAEALLQDERLGAPLAEQAHAHTLLANVELRQGAFGFAAEHATEAVALAERSGDSEALSAALYALGEVEYLEGAWRETKPLDEALRLHERCLEIRREADDLAGVSVSLSRIGVIHERLGDQDRAVACYEESLKAAESADFIEGTSRNLVHLGAAEDRAGNLEAALDYYERSVLASRPSHDVRALTFDLGNVASALARSGGDLTKASECLVEARSLAEGMDWKLGLIRVMQIEAYVSKAGGDTRAARTSLQTAADLSRRYGFAPFERRLSEQIEELEEAASS